MMLLYFFAAIAALAAFTVMAGIKVVRQGYHYTIERFGRALARLGIAERGLAPAFRFEYLALLLAFGT